MLRAIAAQPVILYSIFKSFENVNVLTPQLE